MVIGLGNRVRKAMKVEEEIECPYCNSHFSISYDDNETDGKMQFCPFCREALPEDYDEDDDY